MEEANFGELIKDSRNVTNSLHNDTYDTLIGEEDTLNSTFVKIELIWLPVICGFGLLGNTLSTVTFLRKPLRNSPCSLYLAVRGVSDNGFLCSLLLVWVSIAFDLRLSQVKGVCQFIIFMTYLCGCVSVWLCVFITFENTFLICNPYLAKNICTQRASKISIISLTVIAVGCYNTSLWIVNSDCTHNAKYTSLTQVLVYTDTIFTLVLPTILISILLLVIVYKLLLRMHERKIEVREKRNGYLKARTSIPIKKVTKMLFVVSLIFFILNVPSHVIRIKLLIGRFLKGQNGAENIERSLQTAFLLLYYMSFSTNFLVYITFGSNFRRIFKKSFRSLFKEQQRLKRHKGEALNLVRNRRHSFNENLISSNGFLLTVQHSPRYHSH